MPTMIETQSIVKVLKIVTEDNDVHYVTLEYDLEFKSWHAKLGLESAGNNESSAIHSLMEQCKILGSISLIGIDNTVPS